MLIVAYRGFSDSDGKAKPSEAEIMKDAAKIFEKGIELGKRDNLPVLVLGRSLGGAAAIHVLSRPEFKYAAKGLVLENTFTSIYDVAANMVPTVLSPLKGLLWLITRDSYRSIGKIQDIHVPILFVKGRKDQLVPARLMDELQRRCEESKCEHFTL